MPILDFLRFLVGKEAPDIPKDGFGQSLLDDIRFFVRFRVCRRIAVAWQRPDRDLDDWCDNHPIVGRFGDFTIAVAEVDGRRWIVRDRIWHGWPDPAEFVFFALDGDTIWAAADFDTWPERWTRPISPVASDS